MESNIRVKIVKTINERLHRVYKCKQHEGCNFRVAFGLRHSDKKIIAKNANLRHTGKVLAPISKDNRKWKQPKNGVLDESVETVMRVKSADPLPSDVIKAAQTFKGVKPSYNEAWRALKTKKENSRLNKKRSYQLLIPYLETFVLNNPNSVIDYALDDEQSIKHCFVCHGSMNAKLHHVRPILSIDATFLKEENNKPKCTLYIATALSANNELVPIAFALTRDNENTEGWTMFLRNLNTGCPILSARHKNNNCRAFRYFTFMSDRDKGIINALSEVFPNNHHIHCMVHIARNVIHYGWGIVAGKMVTKIGETYDFTKEIQYFEELQKKSKKAYNYLMSIDPQTWRCTSWLDEQILPPRYGIYTSNVSESANNMFKNAPDGSWLDTVDTMLDIMIKRNSEFQEKYKLYQNKDQVIPRIANHIKKLYSVTAGFQVIKIDDDIGEYKVNRTEYKIGDKPPSHCVNPNNRWCSCGKWQDREFPCIDAIAYYRNYENESLDGILTKYISPFYNCRSLFHLYKKNIKPVIISTLRNDGKTVGPNK